MEAPTERVLREGYRRCRRLTWEYGTTYFWGAAMLPRARRRHVFAIYALCRLADDIVDDPDILASTTVAEREARLTAFANRFRTSLARGHSEDPVMAAVVNTVIQCQIDLECFERFFAAMAMDLNTTIYETFEDLCGYMEGSAAVIGEMMLPVLQPRSAAAREPARALGLAFQVTNFLRDIGEDLERGRAYVPQVELRSFGTDMAARVVTPQWQAFMSLQIQRNRDLYAAADAGIDMLPWASARCVATARVLYAKILDLIEDAEMDVFSARLRVATWHKIAIAARIFVFGPPPTSSRTDVRARKPRL